MPVLADCDFEGSDLVFNPSGTCRKQYYDWLIYVYVCLLCYVCVCPCVHMSESD